MKAKLFKHQEEGIQFLREKKKGLLALDMGMGKTLASIEAARVMGTQNILLIAEKNEIVNYQNFKKETETHFEDLGYVNLRDTSLQEYMEDAPFARAVCGINPDGLVKLDQKVILERFDAMILDESTFAKTATTARFKRVHKIAKDMAYITLLTAMPMMNGASEIYAPLLLMDNPMVAGKGAKGKEAFEIVFAGGHHRHIRNTGIIWKDYMWWAKGANNVRELRWLVRDSFFFKQKSETKIFKKKTRTIERVSMTTEWATEYKEAWDTYYKEAGKRDVKLKNVKELKHVIEKGQMYQVNSRWKASRVASDIANVIYGNDRIVAFSMFVETDELLQKCLTKHGISFKTFDELQEWKDGDEQVLVGRIKAHGKGGNIPEASTALFVDMDYVPANNIQAEERMNRPEQKNNMQVVYYITEGDDVVDKHVQNINKEKIRRIEEFMRPLTQEEIDDMPRRLEQMRIKHSKSMSILGI
jgi:SNF2 family DNA or RNA helicase